MSWILTWKFLTALQLGAIMLMMIEPAHERPRIFIWYVILMV